MGVITGNFEIFLGEDALSLISSRLKSLKFSSGIVLVDSNVARQFRVLEIVSFLSDEGFDIEIQTISLAGEPTYADLDREYQSLLRRNLDFIVAIGGGSLLDLSKGISVLATNEGPGITLRGLHTVLKPGLPLVVFPTTAGTGTEMTWTASFVDSESEIKMGINGDNMFPRFGVLDPKLLLGAPKKVLMSSALDTLVHAIEAVTSTMSNPFTKSLGKSAVEKVLGSLAEALKSEPSLECLEMLQVAASEAGLAMLNSSGGPASGISYPLGVHFKVPHGFAGGLLLPAVIRENLELGFEGYSFFEDAGSDGWKFLSRLENLYLEIEAPSDFSSWGFSSGSDLESIVKLTLDQRFANLKLNPVPFQEQNVRNVLNGFIK
jgi:alcohol dehydrogenase